MLTERTTTLFVSIFYFQKCQTRDYIYLLGLCQSFFPVWPDEFPQQRIGRYDGRVDALEGLEEPQEPAGFGVMDAALVREFDT